MIYLSFISIDQRSLNYGKSSDYSLFLTTKYSIPNNKNISNWTNELRISKEYTIK